MEDFGGWSMQYAAEPCLPSDGGLLGSFLGSGGGCFDLRSDHGGGLNLPSPYPAQNLMPCHDGASLSDGFLGLDTADMLPNVTGALDDDGLLDTFPYDGSDDVLVAEEAVQPTVLVSGYSSTTGGNGNISSGESNTTCGGGGGGGYDTEVASPCALSRSAPTAVPASKRKLGKYPAAVAASARTTEAQVVAAAPRRAAKRDAATSSSSTSISFAGHGHRHHAAAGGSSSAGGGFEPDSEAIAQVKEMIYRAAAMRPVHQLVCGAGAGPSSSQSSKPRRKNVRISSDPQTVAARLRRERVSERLRVLQRLVPGGSRMDTASMLDEAASYLRFLKSQVKALEKANPSNGCYHSSSLLQGYAGSLGGGATGAAASTVLTFGSDGAIGGYVKSNRNMHL